MNRQSCRQTIRWWSHLAGLLQWPQRIVMCIENPSVHREKCTKWISRWTPAAWLSKIPSNHQTYRAHVDPDLAVVTGLHGSVGTVLLEWHWGRKKNVSLFSPGPNLLLSHRDHYFWWQNDSSNKILLPLPLPPFVSLHLRIVMSEGTIELPMTPPDVSFMGTSSMLRYGHIRCRVC